MVNARLARRRPRERFANAASPEFQLFSFQRYLTVRGQDGTCMIGKDLKRSQPEHPGADIPSEKKGRRQFDRV